MQLDLANMPILVLNLREDTAKRAFMEDQLANLGLAARFVEGIKCKPKPIGCALGHLKALRSAGLEPPFLLLEDDCEFVLTRFRTVFEVPDDTDALYLGHSHFGLRDEPDRYGLRWGQRGNVKFEAVGKDYLRVFNMLARHAIVYVSRNFHRSAITAGMRALFDHDFPTPGDMAYAEIQKDHKVLTTVDPICVQSNRHHGNLRATQHSIRHIEAP